MLLLYSLSGGNIYFHDLSFRSHRRYLSGHRPGRICLGKRSRLCVRHYGSLWLDKRSWHDGNRDLSSAHRAKMRYCSHSATGAIYYTVHPWENGCHGNTWGGSVATPQGYPMVKWHRVPKGPVKRYKWKCVRVWACVCVCVWVCVRVRVCVCVCVSPLFGFSSISWNIFNGLTWNLVWTYL